MNKKEKKYDSPWELANAAVVRNSRVNTEL